MKGKGAVLFAVLLALCVCAVLYAGIGCRVLKERTHGYLLERGEDDSLIQRITVRHSFLNVLLSYNEWVIEVVYSDEGEVSYWYTLRDGRITESGISAKKDKEELKHLTD